MPGSISATVRWRKIVAPFAVLAMLLVHLVAAVQPSYAASTELYFSEYIEGSSNNKALEIYNGTGAAVDLAAAGYSVQMFFNGGTSAGLTLALTGTVASGDVYVLAHSSASVAILAQADKTNGSGWFNGDDAVVLRKGTTIIDVIGQIGFDPGSQWGSDPASTADNTLRRKSSVTVGDTNGGDAFDPAAEWDGFAQDMFDGLGSYSATPPVETEPAVTGSGPTNGATNVSAGTNITIGFSEPVNVNPGAITIECPVGTPVAYTAADTSAVTALVLNPTSDLPFNTTCTVTIPAGSVSDVDGNDPPDTLVASFSTAFTSELSPCELTPTLVSVVQGAGLNSPLSGRVTVRGVVTAVFPGLRGFYLQEEVADRDADPVTSEGLFIFTGSTPSVAVGDQVGVTGTVAEFPAGNPSSVTQVGSPTIAKCGDGEAIVPVNILFPMKRLVDFEAYEGMLVRFPQQLFIAEYFNYDRFGEIVLGLPLDGADRFYTPTSIEQPGTAAQALAAQYELRQITLDDGRTTSNPSSLPHPNGQPFSATNRFRGGDTVSGQVGVVDNSFGIYRVHPVQAGTFKARNPWPGRPADYKVKNPRPETPDGVGGTLKVASYNVLNYFLTVDNGSGAVNDICGPAKKQDCRGADSSDELNRQRSKLLQALLSIDADIYGLIELENTPDVEPLADIVAGLNAATAAGTFAYVDTGLIGTDAIKVGIIYKPARVTPVGAHQSIDEQDDPRFDTKRSRPSLAQTFDVNASGARFTVVVNHLKSKGSDCGAADPDTGDGQGNCNLTRELAAQALVDWLATDPTGSGDPDVLIVGDLNAYAKEDPITAIKAGADDASSTADDFGNLIEERLGAYAYSYVFDGQAGYLDHALASSTLKTQVTGVSDWHLNADEPDIFDYNDTVKTTGEEFSEVRGFDVTDTASPFRTSDHDPVLVGLDLVAP